MIFIAALTLSGAIIYLVDSDRGALLITAGCGLALVKWIAGLPTWQSKPPARPDVPPETQEAAQAGGAPESR